MFRVIFEIDLLLKSIDVVFDYLHYDCFCKRTIRVRLRFEFQLGHSNFGTDMKCMYR